MNSQEEHLKPHSIFEDKTFEEHCAILPEFYFRPEVPEDVILNFQVIRKLLVFSYYEYKFLDVAFTKCLQTMEMAMRIRTKELNIYNKKDTFDPLLRKLTDRNIFDNDYNKLKFIKDIRNRDAHPESHTIAGIAYWKRFEFFTFLINDLYDNIELRLERKKKFKSLEELLQKMELERNVVIVIDGEPTILYRFGLLFFNNKYTTPTYLFACTPLFDLSVSDNQIRVPFSFAAKLTDLHIGDNYIKGTSFKNKKEVEVTQTTKFPELAEKSMEWDTEYNKLDGFFRHQFESARTFVIPELVDPEIREFQKM